MIARWKSAFAAIAASALTIAGLSACGSSNDVTAGDEGKMTLVVWASQEDQANADSWLQVMEQEFQKRHPEYDITWNNQVISPADAATIAKQDPTVAADVFMYASDQLGTLKEANAIARMSDDAVEQIKGQYEGSESMIQSVTGDDGYLYGAPFGGNTWFMYYRKSKFTEEDITSLDAMLAKGKVSFPLTNSWYLPAFYMGAGGTLFGPDGTDGEQGVQFGGDTGEAVTNYLIDLRNNPNFVNDANGSGLAGLKSGAVDVVFSGSWDEPTVKQNLGDDYGVAALPTFNLNGKPAQMKAFAGSTVVAWNPYSKRPKASDQFAAFLASTDAQKAHYEMRGTVPSDMTLANEPEIAENLVAKAQIDTIARTSVVQPSIPEMANFWGPCENFGKSILGNEVTHDNARDLTDKWMASYDALM